MDSRYIYYSIIINLSFCIYIHISLLDILHLLEESKGVCLIKILKNLIKILKY